MIYKNDLAYRFSDNPLQTPNMLSPSRPDMKIICLLNPGAFTFDNKIWLIVRVAENFPEKEGIHSFPVLSSSNTLLESFDVLFEDPDLLFQILELLIIKYSIT